MARPRLDPDAPALSGAERQRRYREARRAAGQIEKWVPASAETVDQPAPVPAKKPKKPKVERPLSRPKRWAQAVAAAQDAIAALREVHEEYQGWHDNLPDNLRDSALAAKLEAITEIDLDSLEETLSECECADLPLGFGRD